MIRWTLCLVPFLSLVACSGASPDEEENVSTAADAKKLKDEMCACKDKACAEADAGTRRAVSEELTKCMSKAAIR